MSDDEVIDGMLVFNGIPLYQLIVAFYSGVTWDQLTVQEKGAFFEYNRWKYLVWRDGVRSL